MRATFASALSSAAFLGASLAACGPGAAPRGEAHAPAAHDEGGAEHHEEGIPESVRLSSAAIAEAGIGTWTVAPVNPEHLLVLNGQVGHDENRVLQVGANVRGRVVSIPVDLGARVSRGDVLVTVESVELGRAREDLVRALAALGVAGRAYERARNLVEAKAISEGEFQEREGAYLAQKAAADAAERTLHILGESQARIDRLRAATESGSDDPEDGAALAIRAPFAGRVIDREVTPGTLFEAMQPLLTLADISTVWVFAQAYEKDVALLRAGAAVRLRTEAWPQEVFQGRVDFVGSVIDPATRTLRVRATVPNPDEKLRPGMFVRARVDVPRAYEGDTVLAVPESALQTLEGRTTVFVQSEPGLFTRRLVETGQRFEGFTEVYSGIRAGDVVVTEGSFVLKSEFARASLAHEH